MWLVSDAQNNLELYLTLRSQTAGKALVYLNDQKVQTLSLAPQFVCYRIVIQAEMLDRGANKLGIRWPLPHASDDPLAALVKNLQDDGPSQPHYIFGDLFRVTATIPS